MTTKGVFQFRTRAILVLAGRSYSNQLPSGLRLRRNNATWLDGAQQQKRTLHAFDHLFCDRAKDHRPPARDAVGGNHDHIDMLTLNSQHDIAHHVVANLNRGLALIPRAASEASHVANCRFASLSAL